MNKTNKYSLFAFGIFVIGMSIVSIAFQSWVPLGVALSVVGVMGMIFAPLLATFDFD